MDHLRFREEEDYKNLNKNDIEDMYMLIINHKVDDYTKTGLLWSLSVFNRSTVIWERVHDFQLVYGIIYKNNKKEKREMRHQKVHKFCDATLKRVLEGLKSYNNDVKYGYVTHNLSKEDVEYLQLFAEEIEERLKYRIAESSILRAFSLFLLALAASEVFGADEDAGSVVAWSPLVIISHSESGWCYTDDMKYTRTYRHTQCWHKEQRWRDELRLQICFWIEQTRRETRGVVENTGGDDFGGIFVLLAGDVTLGEVGGCWDWEVELGVIQAAGTTRIKGERFNEIKEMSETSVANDTLGLVPQRQKASDYDNSGPVPQLQNVSPSADTIVSLRQELDLLFGPLYDEVFTAGTSSVNNSSSPTDNSKQQDTPPTTNIQYSTEPTNPTNVNAKENNDNQAEDTQLHQDEFINPFCTPVQEIANSSSCNIDNSNMHAFYQPHDSEYR
ncbi:hypothetical protein Tco_0595674 [Tanacetum coccineum]